MIRNFGSVQGIKGQPQGLSLGLGLGGNASVGDVLSGKTFSNDLGEQIGTGANAKRMSSGTITSSASAGTLNFSLDGAGGTTSAYVTVTGLTFRPSLILVYYIGGNNYFPTIYRQNGLYKNATTDACVIGGSYQFRETGNLVVSSTGFTLPVEATSTVYNWIAYE